MALFLAACSSGSPSASPSPGDSVATPAPDPSTLPAGVVTSERFGWSMELPAGWIYRPATEDWPVHTYPAAGAAYTDNFEKPEGFPVIDVSTQRLPTDQTPDEFLTDLDAGNNRIGCTVEQTDEITVDGSVGRFQRQSCAQGSEIAWEVAVIDGDRVYLIYWIALTNAVTDDEDQFHQMLSTFQFADG
jgi:hypothetical protein